MGCLAWFVYSLATTDGAAICNRTASVLICELCTASCAIACTTVVCQPTACSAVTYQRGATTTCTNVNKAPASVFALQQMSWANEACSNSACQALGAQWWHSIRWQTVGEALLCAAATHASFYCMRQLNKRRAYQPRPVCTISA